MTTAGPECAPDAPPPSPPEGAVLLVDDHVLLAQTLAVTLRVEGVVVDIARLESQEAIIAQAEERPYAVVLLDLDLGEAIGDGVDLAAALGATGAHVVIVTGSGDRMRIAAALEQGAIGWVGKHQPYEEIVQAIRDARTADSLLPDAQRQDLLDELRRQRQARDRKLAPFAKLTAREVAVLRAIATGDTAEEVAASSYVSISTVRSQIRAILQKLGVNSQVQAIAAAHETGWMQGR